MTILKRTPLFPSHVALGAKMVDFAGWDMPLMYPTGVVAEHLATRRTRRPVRRLPHGPLRRRAAPGALAFLQRVLSNNAAALDVRPGPVHLHPHRDRRRHRRRLPLPLRRGRVPAGGQRRQPREGLGPPAGAQLAGPRRGRAPATAAPSSADPRGPHASSWPCSRCRARSPGRSSPACSTEGTLPEPRRNELSVVTDRRRPRPARPHRLHRRAALLRALRPRRARPGLWDLLVEKGAVPCGLGARDTLRLEAGLPLYGHELGIDPEGREIPLMSSPLAAFAVSFSPVKGDFVGPGGAPAPAGGLPAHPGPRLLPHRRPAPHHPARRRHRAGSGPGRRPRSRKDGRPVGWVTSGTMVPYWKMAGEKLESRPGDELRAALHLSRPARQRHPSRTTR